MKMDVEDDDDDDDDDEDDDDEEDEYVLGFSFSHNVVTFLDRC